MQRIRELEVRKCEEGEVFSEKKQKRAYNQLMTGTVSVATLIWLLEKRVEQLWEGLVCK
jgi:hypothetical protein